MNDAQDPIIIIGIDPFARKLAGQRKDLTSPKGSGFIMYDCDLAEHLNGGVALLIKEPPQRVREEKVRDIRRLIREGRYRVFDRLDEVVEALLSLYGG